MPPTTHVDRLLPWYANGTLDERDRARVDRHVAACSRCREMLEQERGMMALAGLELPPEHLEHVHPMLLTRYAEDRSSLDDESIRAVEQRLGACSVCREAFERLQRLEFQLVQDAPVSARRRPSTAERAAGWLAWSWNALTATVLRPAPALAYLLLLVLLVPAVWMLRPGPTSDGPGTPGIVFVDGEAATREGTTAAAPLDVVSTGSGVVLLLRTDLVEQDLERLGLQLILERDGAAVLEQSQSAADFQIIDGRAVLPLALGPGLLEPGHDYRVVLRAVLPGDPLHDQPLFRRDLRVRP